MAQVITRLLGGLGNQMFQYAAARALALAQGGALWLDARALRAPGPHTRRDFALNVFDIRAELADDARLQQFKGRQVVESSPRYDERVSQAAMDDGDLYLAGYWQSERYFSAIRPVLQRDFQLRQVPGADARAWAERMRRSASVALHVRRGDYISNPQAAAHHGSCEPAYYRAALSELRRRHGDIEVYAFTDDPQWVREHLQPGQPLHVVSREQQPAHEDLWLMQHCRHYVLANSSFSWWGAWLGSTPQSSVIAPRQWVRTPGFDARDVVPGRWVRL